MLARHGRECGLLFTALLVMFFFVWSFACLGLRKWDWLLGSVDWLTGVASQAIMITDAAQSLESLSTLMVCNTSSFCFIALDQLKAISTEYLPNDDIAHTSHRACFHHVSFCSLTQDGVPGKQFDVDHHARIKYVSLDDHTEHCHNPRFLGYLACCAAVLGLMLEESTHDWRKDRVRN